MLPNDVSRNHIKGQSLKKFLSQMRSRKEQLSTWNKKKSNLCGIAEPTQLYVTMECLCPQTKMQSQNVAEVYLPSFKLSLQAKYSAFLHWRNSVLTVWNIQL